MAQLYDYRLGTSVTVADSRVSQLLGSGNYSFLAGDDIHVLDEKGSLYTVPPESAHLALQEGYTYAPTEVVEESKLRQTIADSPGTAAALGALRTTTLGLSDAALQTVGFTDSEIRMHRELNPIATTLGEVGGLVNPFGGTSLVARGALKAGRALAGHLASKATATGLRRTGSALNSRAVKGAVGGAAEGAVVGVPYAVSSNILDDPEMRPTLASHIYAGAGFGSVAGGLMGALSSVIRTGSGKFKQIADTAYFRALDPRKGEWNMVTKHGKYPDAVQELGAKIRALDKKGVLKNLDDAPELVRELDDTLLPAFGQQIDDLISRVMGAIKKSGQSFDDVAFNPDTIADRMTREILDNPQVLARGIVNEPQQLAKIARAEKSIEAFRDVAYRNLHPMIKKMGLKGKTLSFKDSEELKRFYQRELANWKKNPENYDYFQAMAKIIREESENSLDTIATKLSEIGGLPKSTYAEFVEAKEIYKALRQIRDIASGAAARQAINNRIPLTSYIIGGGLGGGALGGADTILTGGLGGAATFATAALARKYLRDSGELLLARTMGRISEYGEVLNLANRSEKEIAKYVGMLTRSGETASVKITSPAPPTQREQVKQFERVRDTIQDLSGNPEALYVRLEQMVPQVEGDQTITQDLMQTMATAVTHLNSKIPQNPIANDGLVFRQDRGSPSQVTMMRFFRHVEVVNNPNIVLQHLINGSLQTEHMDTIRDVFPRLLDAQLKSLLQSLMQTRNSRFSASQKQSLTLFLGEPMETSMQPLVLQQTQSQYAALREQPQQPPKGSVLQMPDSRTQAQRLEGT